MNLKHQIEKSLKWKQSNEFCANKLGISIEEYKQLKRNYLDSQIKDGINSFKESLEKGTAEVTGVFSTEPKSPEEIEKVLKIDTSKWKLSSYWNKEQNGKWLVSAMITRIKNDPAIDIKKVLSELKLEYTPTEITHLNSNFKDKTCAVLSLQDIHIAKETLEKTGSIEESVRKCIHSLILRSYHSSYLDKIVFVLGGDLLNMDTYFGTTTAGTPIENSVPAIEAYKLAFDLMFWSVSFLKEFCNELEVVYIPGNHSRLTEAHIAYSLSKSIIDPNIIWNIEYAERKVVVYGNSMICMEHGDFNINRSFFVFATEFAKEWGSCEYRTLYTGHTHKEKKIEYITTDEVNGFTMRVLPSLSKTDKFHYSNKWTGNKRAGIIDLHSETNGITGSFTYIDK